MVSAIWLWPEDFHDNPGWHALGKQEAGGCAPEVVQPDWWQSGPAKQLLELPVVIARIDGSSDRRGEHAWAPSPKRGCGDLLLLLLLSVCLQGSDQGRWERDRALAPLRLWVGQNESTAALPLQGPANTKQPGGQVPRPLDYERP